MRFARTFVLAFLSLLAIASGTHAQDPSTVEQGMKPYGSYEGGDIDSISMINGLITLHIPLISYPQRGGRLRAGFSVYFQNPRYAPWDNCPPPPKLCTNSNTAGYYLQYGSTGTAHAISIGPDFTFLINNNANYGQPSAYYVSSPDGAGHRLEPIDSSNYRSTDTTGFIWNKTTEVLIDRQGTRYSINTVNGNPIDDSQIEDANGNLLTTNYGTASNGGIYIQSWTDTLGRTLPAPLAVNAVTTTDFTGCSGTQPTTSATLWTPPGLNGGTSQFKACYAAFPINFQPPDCTGICIATGGTTTQIQSIVLPNGTAWTFELDTNGALSKIGLPTGGSISYTSTWQKSGNIQGHDALFPYNRPTTSRAVDANDGTGPHTWTYTVGTQAATMTVTDPLGNDAVHFLTGGYENELDRYQGSSSNGTLLLKTTTVYNSTTDPYDGPVMNVAPTSVTTTDLLSGKVTQVTKTYDAGVPLVPINGQNPNVIYGDVLSQSTYDYGNNSPGLLLRTINTTYMALSGPNASSYLANNFLSLSYTVQTLNGSGTQVALTTYGYDGSSLVSSGVTTQHDSAPPSGAYRGNQTSVSRWLNTTNTNLISTTNIYDTGAVPTATDPLSHAVTRAYSASFAGAYTTTVTNALNQSANHNYDFNTGMLTSTTDPNGLTTSFSYDNMWRVASVTAPDGGVAIITHQETTFPFTATLNKPINASQTETTTNVFDGLGRVTHSQLNSDPQGTVYTDTTYDALGRVATVSNPHRTCGSDTTSSCGTTSYGYDPLSRKTSETYPDGSVLTTAYCGPSTLVTDPTGKWRRSRVDGLGRLVEVDEPNSPTATIATTGCPGTGEPIWVTTYGYDTLGNLTSVLQNGSHQRSFLYDSLSRLLTSTNPEVGQISYAYNNDSVLISKTDARSITTNYSPSDSPIDVLHRVTKIAYSNGDPSITYAYDQANCLGLPACQNIGHRTGMTDAAGSEAWSFQVDAANHRSVHVNQRTTNSITKTSTYYFDQAGNVTQAVYPTGRVVNYTFDNADRPSTATDGSNGITYATDFQTVPTGCLAGAVCYTPQGTFYALSIGQATGFTGLNLTHTYNNRLQPNEFKASSSGGNAIDISYNFVAPSTNHNSGHVYGITNNLDTTRSQTFGYDQLNRISSAQTTSIYSTSPGNCWSETYSLDAWGNLNSITGTSNSNYTGCSQEGGFSTTADGNNHIPLWGYDASGNATSDGTFSYVWDGESQLKSAGGVNYLYDGNGRRVSKSSGTLYWYGSGNDILAETDISGNTTAEYVFFGGKRVAGLAAGTPGTDSATIGGSEQSVAGSAAVAGTGSVTFSGTLQSKQVQTQAAAPGSGSVTISGTEGSKSVYNTGCRCLMTTYDAGTVNVTVNGRVDSTSYDRYSTSSTIASGLVTSINADSAASVTASASGSTVTLRAKTTGSSTNYSLSASVTSQTGFSPPSFATTPSGPALTGGTNAAYTTVYDSGTSTITVNGHNDSVSWSGSGTTTSSIASGLASAINGDSAASVSASVSSTTVNLTAKTTGASTNYSLSSSSTYDSSNFSSASFSSNNSGSTLIGGANTGAPTYDSGSVWITINGTQYSVSYGQSSLSSSIASALATAISAGTLANATASGSGITITAKSGGAGTNYSLSAGSSTSQPGSFPSGSFTVATSGSSLSGGKDGILYYVEDMLGTSRVLTTDTGVVCYDADFYPYGGERSYTNTCHQNYKFEGKERDTETGNDDFGARYYSNRFGRWLSADWSAVPEPVPYANLTNPQTLNLYAMVSDDPESFADLDGHLQTSNVGTTNYAAEPCDMNGTYAPGCGEDKSAKNNQANQAAQQTITWTTVDNNYARTLTVTKIDTTTVTADDGTKTTTVVKTIVTFSTDQANVGEVVGGRQIVTASQTTSDGKTTPIYDNSPFGDRITAQAAKRAFGDKAFNAAQMAAIPGRAEFFNRALRDDRKGWAKAAGETALLAVPVSKAYELYKAIGDVALGAYNLYRDIKEARHPEQ